MHRSFSILACLLIVITSTPCQTLPGSPSSPAQPQLKAATLSLSQGDYTQARKLFLKAKKIDPSVKGVDYQLGAIALMSGQTQEARVLLEKSLAANDAVADCQNLLGGMLLQEGHFSEAIEHLQAAIAAAPELSQAYANLALAYRLNFEPQKAIEPLRKAAVLDPQQRPVYEFKLRLAMIEAGQSAEIDKAMAGHLASPEVESDWVLTAAALDLRRGRTAEAAERLRQAKAAMPPELFAAMLEDRAFKAHADQSQIAEFYKAP